MPETFAGCTNVQYTILGADDNEEADPEYPQRAFRICWV
ncbi:hypothetical protein GARC_3939 [Paraglaciecola arctica BSs20135]|uniref:Uncharacterized protein n=1 Tax=Paraglaciecola arctica BSs20135 TaxID=493475 RepID=K6YAD8_9ALTE|nr:hypothetical protein GARC_3939 [Paraglaciecola arctica BSs20135]